MQLYRICPQAYLQDFSGLGASYKDGARWNSAGLPVLYFALSPATALLEMANYIPSPRLVPPSYRMGIYELPEQVKLDQLSSKQLPDDWAQYPYPKSTQILGDQWLNAGEALGLLVPSTAVSAGLEQIVLINPRHLQINQLQLTDSIKELYNKRSFMGM